MQIDGYESNDIILKELGQRIRDIRIATDYTQQEMAKRSGVALSTLVRVESGESVTFEKILNILRGLGMISNLDLLVPQQGIDPIDIIDHKAKRKRASRNRNHAVNPDWVWGEDRK